MIFEILERKCRPDASNPPTTEVCRGNVVTNGNRDTLIAVITNNEYYKCSVSGGIPTIQRWEEYTL